MVTIHTVHEYNYPENKYVKIIVNMLVTLSRGLCLCYDC